MEVKKIRKTGIGRKIRNQFMAGLLVMIPLGATILILVWLFNSIDHILHPVINAIYHGGWFWNTENTGVQTDIPGLGFGVTVILIYIVGTIATNVLGKRLIKWGDTILDKVPIFRLVYRSIRQIIASFSIADDTFMQVVLVEFPQKGQKTMAFVTNEIIGKDGKKLYSVLIPTAPNPTSGFMEILKEEDIIRTNIPVDEAIKMIISAGKVMPDEVRAKFQ
jgi:uncharacterized membrane protein